MNKNLKLILVAAVAVTVSASAHQTTRGLVDSQGQVARNNFGDCVEAITNEANADCGGVKAEEPELIVVPFTLGAHALFDTDKSVLKTAGKEQLDELATKIKKGQELGRIKSVQGVSIVGHTDSVGRAAYNQGLSERRAASVRNYLVEMGVDSSMLTASGEGEMNPVADNATREGRQQNRRVEISVSGTAVKTEMK